jgi:hypothetical protein
LRRKVRGRQIRRTAGRVRKEGEKMKKMVEDEEKGQNM